MEGEPLPVEPRARAAREGGTAARTKPRDDWPVINYEIMRRLEDDGEPDNVEKCAEEIFEWYEAKFGAGKRLASAPCAPRRSRI